jgi:hypothetical protein
MCARRFLIFVFILILLFVAGAFAIFQFGQQVLIRQATPRGHFERPTPNSGPDYAKLTSWISHPDILIPSESVQSIEDDPARWQPEQEVPYDLKPGAATFFIHPTTYLNRDRWNAPLNPDRETEIRTRLFARSQASAFFALGNVWSPRYRQAAYGAFLLKNDDARKALELAYSDVLAAFDQFVKENPQGPIVLAGHSQGALHLSRLLRDRAETLSGRLVAAYVVGWPLSVTADLPSMSLQACASPEQAGCILSWQSFAEPANPDLIVDAWEDTKGPTGLKRKREDMLCVNPLTGTRDGAAPPQANPGTLVPTTDVSNALLEPRKVGAHCEKGLLILDGEIPPLGPYVLPGNNFHVYDYALFWGAIRKDAGRRLRAWQHR